MRTQGHFVLCHARLQVLRFKVHHLLRLEDISDKIEMLSQLSYICSCLMEQNTIVYGVHHPPSIHQLYL